MDDSVLVGVLQRLGELQCPISDVLQGWPASRSVMGEVSPRCPVHHQEVISPGN